MAKKTSGTKTKKTAPSTVDASLVHQLLEAGEGILRLAPTWVPRSFLMPGRRIKLAPQGPLRPRRPPRRHRRALVRLDHAGRQREPRRDEGLSYVVHEATSASSRSRTPSSSKGQSWSARRSGTSTSAGRSTASSSTTSGRSRTTCTRTRRRRPRSGSEGKPESYYFPPQLNALGNNFPYTFFGLEPGTTKDDIRRCLERWNKGDNGILNYSKAYRLQPGTGWLVPPCVLHAPGSLVTYEPQWGSDVFGMYQSMVEGRSCALELARQGRAQETSTTTSITWSSSSTGRRTSTRVSRTATTSSRSSPGRQRRGGLRRSAGSSTARSMASSCSPPRS